MSCIHANLRHWLVENPMISDFQWNEEQTWGASTQFLIATLLSYLSCIAILLYSSRSRSLPNPNTTSSTPLFLRLFSPLYNLLLLLISLIMAVGCTLSTISQMPHIRWIFCFPSGGGAGRTPPSGPVFFWAYIFYLSKILEFSDTLLILLNRSSGNRRLTFLHVYHHALVVVVCYLWLQQSQSLFPVALVTNAMVHTLMYAYYLMCSLGKRPPWKRVVTNCQIVQFLFSFAVSIVLLWFHFGGGEGGGGGCSGMKAWAFNALFNASLLVLFLNFHAKTYPNEEEKKRR
eukprot:TRINITY_DN22248_c0_g1_i1.p1 TRINITY_DN22248_c0_g1~~TRINITY_DN22248_c0_g1_i1.p1  ORF type:complete len:288 (-),score=11.08 TRINITY_DN22248_c0_g1_i1:24-887(-)